MNLDDARLIPKKMKREYKEDILSKTKQQQKKLCGIECSQALSPFDPFKSYSDSIVPFFHLVL